MNEMVKLNANLPAHLQGVKVENVFQSAASEGGFPVISLKGKDFTIVRSGEKEIIKQRVLSLLIFLWNEFFPNVSLHHLYKPLGVFSSKHSLKAYYNPHLY